MTTSNSTPSQGNTAAAGGDHDRVAMLSLNADGTPDQHDPEVIGDKAAAVAATQEQMAQQAVSAMEQRRMSDTSTAEVEAAKADQDALIAARLAEQEKVAAAAEKRAATVVSDLHQG